MNNLAWPESGNVAGKSTQFPFECWLDDTCILDMDKFVKTLAGIKSKGVRPDLIGSIIAHYSSKWLPDLGRTDSVLGPQDHQSPESVTVSWMKKRFFVETLVGILPPEKNSIPCNFLLRLLRTANMVGVEPTCQAELEKRLSWVLDHVSLNELMIPSFSHTCGTLLDVELVTRLVKRFVNLDEAIRSGAALIKVAKLVDSYLAEAALEANLGLSEFVNLAGAIPENARATNDGLYRAIDTYLKAHPGVSKQERKNLCRLMDPQKLTPEASFHAAQNDRLPVRVVIQALFSEQMKLNRHIDWSGSFTTARSPTIGLDRPARCHSKRETAAQQMEIKKLREEVIRLKKQCNSMQEQMEKVLEKKKGFFRWKKIGLMPYFKSLSVAGQIEEQDVGDGMETPTDMKMKLVKGTTLSRWRRSSMS